MARRHNLARVMLADPRHDHRTIGDMPLQQDPAILLISVAPFSMASVTARGRFAKNEGPKFAV